MNKTLIEHSHGYGGKEKVPVRVGKGSPKQFGGVGTAKAAGWMIIFINLNFMLDD